MERIVGFIIFISLLIFGVYFLDKGKLGAGTFTSFMSVVLICGLAFYGFDRLKELDIKNLRMILSEMKETKKDIEKEVDTLLVALAESNISSALVTCRLPPSRSCKRASGAVRGPAGSRAAFPHRHRPCSPSGPGEWPAQPAQPGPGSPQAPPVRPAWRRPWPPAALP